MENSHRYIEMLFIATVNKTLDDLSIKDYSLIFKLFWNQQAELLTSLYNKLINENNYIIDEVAAFKKEFEQNGVLWGNRRISKFFKVPEIRFIQLYKEQKNIIVKENILNDIQLKVITEFLKRKEKNHKNTTLKGIYF